LDLPATHLDLRATWISPAADELDKCPNLLIVFYIGSFPGDFIGSEPKASAFTRA
jgi:hypothetical protein